MKVDDILQALRDAGLEYRGDPTSPSRWSAQCPICIASTTEHVVTIREPRRGAHASMVCSNGCASIDERLQPSKHLPLAGDGLTARAADLARSRPPRWAWNGRIALGALNLVLGAEGVGKGTLAAWVIAKITRGTLPGDLEGTPTAVGLLGDEDGFDDVWAPRLHAAEADLALVKLIERPDGGYIELAKDHADLTAVIAAEQIRVLWCDALLDNLGAIDDWRSKQVRDALAPLRAIARDLEIAPVGAMHPNKQGNSFRQLVAGSVAFNALSRSSLLLAQHPDDEDRRVVLRGKGNLSRTPEALQFVIETASFEANGYRFNVPRAVDFGESKLTIDDLIGPAAAPPPRPAGEARTSARDLVAQLLGDRDWHPASEIIATCEQQGSYRRAVQRAANDLGCEQEWRGRPPTSYWRLPSGDAQTSHLSPVAPVIPVIATRDDRYSSHDTNNPRDDSDDGTTACHGSVSPPLNALTAA